MHAIVGRDEELATLERFLDGISAGARALVLEGEAGVGKTTLWSAGLDAARRHSQRVLLARPGEPEQDLSFAGVTDLLAPILDEALPRLPEPQARALQVALLLVEPGEEAPDRRTVALAVLATLRAAAVDGPLLVAVDDVQWLDAPSRAALSFAARRLREEPVGLLVAERVGLRPLDPLDLGHAFAEERLIRVLVGPLSLGALNVLLVERLGLILARPALRRVHESSGGNPFFALEIGRALQRRRGEIAPGEPLPVPDELHELVQDRLEALPVGTRRALATAAALSAPTLEVTGPLDAAIEARVVEMVDGCVRFTHPLLASGAYALLPPAERSRLHARLAEAVADPDERAHHLARSVREPDGEVAAALEAAAERARARGAISRAAELWEEAVRLTPTGFAPESRRRTAGAAMAHFEAGDSRRARSLLEGALDGLAAGPERAYLLVRLARVRAYDDDIRAAAQLFAQAATETNETRVAAEAHEGVAGSLFRLRERFAEAATHADRAAALRAELGEPAPEALNCRLLAEAAFGREEARDTLAEVLALQPSAGRARILHQPDFHAAVCWLWWGELARARTTYEGLLARANELGDESSVPYVLVLLGHAEVLLGDLVAAAARVEEGLATAAGAGQETLGSYLLGLRAVIEAHAGDVAAARAAGGQALAIAERTSGKPSEVLARWALGLAALAGNEHAAAAEALGPLVDHVRRVGFAEPGAIRFVPDAVEALIELGREDEAVELLDWYEGNARRLERASVLLACARCRALLRAKAGDVDGALVVLVESLEVHRDDSPPHDRARALLLSGAVRRRLRQKRSAREALEEAAVAFASLPAPGWEERARAELARIGGRGPATGALTPTEERISALVAEGLSNKEIAARLFLSVKTVEGHLSRVYAKLGIRTRAALAGRRSDRS